MACFFRGITCLAIVAAATELESNCLEEEAEETCALQHRHAEVSCGGHRAPSCDKCPQGQGEAWCHGDCIWSSGKCVAKSGKACCLAMTADCLACSADQTVPEYCADNPQTAGCPKPCCKAMTVDCLACSAGKTVPEYCADNPQTEGCPGKPCCKAMTAECLACSAGMTEPEYCAESPQTAGCPDVQGGACALCETCGGDFPADSGRATYFQGETNKFRSYGVSCGAAIWEKDGDGNVIFSPKMCCKESTALLETRALEIKAHDFVAANKSQTAAGGGWCSVCSSCGGEYSKYGGSLTYMDKDSSWHSNSQNYVSKGHGCDGGSQTKGAPPAGSVCCKPQPSNRGLGACSVCQGQCGGGFPVESGTLTWTDKSVNYEGLGEYCGSTLTKRSGKDAMFCCMR